MGYYITPYNENDGIRVGLDSRVKNGPAFLMANYRCQKNGRYQVPEKLPMFDYHNLVIVTNSQTKNRGSELILSPCFIIGSLGRT